MKRRSFLRLAAALPFAARAGAFPRRPEPDRIDPGRSGDGPYSGDEFRLAHRYLRDGTPLPAPAGEPDRLRDAIVVGSGPSGLMAAWMLSDLDVLVLEKDRLPGGTSKSESWNGIPYAIGAAYLGVPERGTALGRFYKALGLDRAWRTFRDKDMGIFRGTKLEMGYWERPDRHTIAAAFTAMLENRYTDLPFVPNEAWTREEMAAVDRLSWAQLLEQGLPVARGKPPVKLPGEMAQFCELFAPAVLAAKPDECSAWVMLNQFLAEFGQLAALPGGNGMVTKRLVERLDAHGARRVRTGHMVTSIQDGPAHATVTAIVEGQTKVFRARSVIFAGPKFVAARIVKGLPDEQLHAIGQILYRPFLVANACLKKSVVDRNMYDAYTLELPGSDLSDFTFADYAARPAGPESVITCYFPLPRDDARTQLMDDANLKHHRASLERDLLAVLAPRGLTREDIVEMRFTRWGHPMPVARPGQLASGVFDRAAKPFGRVLFAHQDNYGNPCIESCFAAAQESAGRARSMAAPKAKKARKRRG